MMSSSLAMARTPPSENVNVAHATLNAPRSRTPTVLATRTPSRKLVPLTATGLQTPTRTAGPGARTLCGEVSQTHKQPGEPGRACPVESRLENVEALRPSVVMPGWACTEKAVVLRTDAKVISRHAVGAPDWRKCDQDLEGDLLVVAASRPVF